MQFYRGGEMLKETSFSVQQKSFFWIVAIYKFVFHLLEMLFKIYALG